MKVTELTEGYKFKSFKILRWKSQIYVHKIKRVIENLFGKNPKKTGIRKLELIQRKRRN